ncbi:MAG: TonB family protein, partial [Bacteroidetes bacterium]|nr:TonB family protein [Bacteroidota bacterium]
LVFNLNHKNLLIPKHFDEFEGSPYLVLPYCRQGSVFCKIGEVSEQELARFMQQASSALNYLHNQDPPIIHQDIKPDNFLIDGNGNYLLADFGISSKIRRTLTKSMGAQASTGTLAYMPPEKFSADKQIIKAGDIFSLGVTMYELLTGDLPFGDNGGLTLKAGAEVPNLPGNFSPELNSLLKKCLSKEPWDRPTAEQLEEVAGKFLQTGQWTEVGKDATKSEPEPSKEPEQPRGGRKTETIPQRQPEPQTESKFEPEPEPENRRNLTPWIIASAVVAVGIVAAIFWTKGPSANELREKARIDSIRISDSIAMTQAEQQRILDSMALAAPQQEPTSTSLKKSQNGSPENKNDGPADAVEIFTMVEEMPCYPGGDDARVSFLRQNIKYPEEARELGIQGTVYSSFVVEKDGSITDIQILRGIGGGCDEEVIRIIKAMPKWVPGKQRGATVRVQFKMPLKFTLSN